MKYIIHLIYMLLISQINFSQNIFDLEHSDIYADHLFQIKDFDTAVKEYERLVEMASDSLFYKERLLKSYKLSNQIDNGIKVTEIYFGKQYDEYPTTIMKNFIELLFLNFDQNFTEQILKREICLSENELAEFQLAHFILSKQYRKADSLILLKNTSFVNAPIKYNELVKLYDTVLNTAYKNSFLASALSAVIPGSGKVYANDFHNGAIVFTIISLYSLQSYKSFKIEGIESVYGWGFGILAAGFYISNIYGSYRSTVRENKYLDEQIKKDVLEIIINKN